MVFHQTTPQQPSPPQPEPEPGTNTAENSGAIDQPPTVARGVRKGRFLVFEHQIGPCVHQLPHVHKHGHLAHAQAAPEQ